MTTGPRFLRLRVVPNAVLVPRRDHRDRSQGAGVLRRTDDGLVVVEDCGTRRRGREYVEPPPVSGVRPTGRLDTAVFAGYVWDHFGHFLLESLGRTWMPSLDPSVPVVWLAATGDRLEPWMDAMADHVGIGPDRRVLVGPEAALEVGRLLVADQGFEVRRHLHPWFAARLATTEHRPDGSKVWLSRSRLADGGLAEEADLEAVLADDGWTIVHPESLDLTEQIDVLARAAHVAGVEGSALHTLLFVRGYRGTVDIVSRHEDQNFEVIATTTGWDQVRHAPVGGTSQTFQRPNGSRDVRWTGVDAVATAHLVRRSAARR